jgi:hypothetical protein
MANIFGSDPNQIPLNGMLGDMAYQSSEGIIVEKIQSSVGFGTTAGDFTASTVLQLQPISGNTVIGTGTSLGTAATSGFVFIPSCAGAPTGTPVGILTAPYTGVVPMIADTTNNRLYIRIGSTWRYASLT